MTLIEHIRELRTRLFKASLGVLVGTVAGFLVSDDIFAILKAPYCEFFIEQTGEACSFVGNPLDAFLLKLKISLYAGLVLAAPIWLYQLWAFVAPGLHKRERRYGYTFAAIATPLFAAGFVLGFYLVARSLPLFLGLLDDAVITVNLSGYFEFVTGVMLLFGAGFEIPLILLMLNIAGVLSAKRLLGWWRIAVFLFFLFAAIVTPTPDPFNMTILALCMSALYFAAVGVAFLIDARRGRRDPYANLSDDEISPIEPVSPVDAPRWGAEPHDGDNR